MEMGVDVKTVALWRARFAEGGAKGLWEVAAGRGRKATHPPDKIKAIVQATLLTKPKGMTHWSCRQMAQAQGVSKSTVSNIWRSHNLKPHRAKSFKLSRDAKFLEKLTDVVGLFTSALPNGLPWPTTESLRMYWRPSRSSPAASDASETKI